MAVGVSCYDFWDSLQEVKEEVVEEGEELEEEGEGGGGKGGGGVGRGRGGGGGASVTER